MEQEVVNDEPNFEGMTSEQIGQYLDEQEGLSNDTTEHSEPDISEEDPKEGQAENDQQSDEDQADSEDQSGGGSKDEEDPDDDIEDFYRGKSAKELVSIIKNGTKKISTQENELNRIRQEIDSLKKASAQAQEKDDDIDLSDYNEEEVQLIQALIRKEQANAKQKEEEQTKQQREASVQDAKNSNNVFFDNLLEIQPELATEFESEIRKEIQNDVGNNLENTYHKKGWLKDFYKSWLKSRTGKTSPEHDETNTAKSTIVKRRKVNANLPGHSRLTTSTKNVTKSVDEMTSDEYLEYCHENGITI